MRYLASKLRSDAAAPVNLDANELAQASFETQKWKTLPLREDQGNGHFLIGKICRDISVTHSKCRFDNNYEACIQYTEQTALLVFGLSGHSVFQLASLPHHTHTIHSGDVWFFHVNEDYLFRTTSANQLNEMIVIKYSGQRLKDVILDSDETSPLFGVRMAHLGQLATLESGVSDILDNPLDSATHRLLAESQALQLLARWITSTEPEYKSSQTPNIEHLSTAELNGLRRVVDVMTADLIRTPPLPVLAKHANMSHTKLNRCFKKAYGTTVYDWLRQYRLERARGYLTTTNKIITEIACQCGFSSASHFAQVFKQHYHCTPVAYRERLNHA
ncbi:MAG: AraC family transcriptional regulator [Pseudomonadota bacterium]